MRCPNCHSVAVNNQGLCPYCGFDIGEYVRTVQDEGMTTIQKRETRETAEYARGRSVLTQPSYNYENGYFYYKREYEREKNKNDRYKRNLLLGGAAIVLMLHFAELLALAAIYLT